MNKQNASCSSSTKEEEQKQFGKAGSKGEASRFKPAESKTQPKKADTQTKAHGKECSMEDDDEECEDTE